MKLRCDQEPRDFMTVDTEGVEVHFAMFVVGQEGCAEILFTEKGKVQDLRDALTDWLERNQ